MKKICLLLLCAVMVATLLGCSSLNAKEEYVVQSIQSFKNDLVNPASLQIHSIELFADLFPDTKAFVMDFTASTRGGGFNRDRVLFLNGSWTRFSDMDNSDWGRYFEVDWEDFASDWNDFQLDGFGFDTRAYVITSILIAQYEVKEISNSPPNLTIIDTDRILRAIG